MFWIYCFVLLSSMVTADRLHKLSQSCFWNLWYVVHYQCLSITLSPSQFCLWDFAGHTLIHKRNSKIMRKVSREGNGTPTDVGGNVLAWAQCGSGMAGWRTAGNYHDSVQLIIWEDDEMDKTHTMGSAALNRSSKKISLIIRLLLCCLSDDMAKLAKLNWDKLNVI